jgi:hypothetical protein
MMFQDMRVKGELLRDEYSTEGDFFVNSKSSGGIVYLPANHEGQITLEFNQNPDFEMRRVTATRVRSLLEGQFEIEAFWDGSGNITSA